MRRFRCFRFLAVWKSNKRANRKPSSCNHLGAFYLTCFVRVCEIFTAWKASRNMVLTLCFNVFLPPHVQYVQCICLFFWAQIRKKTDVKLIKNEGHVLTHAHPFFSYLCSKQLSNIQTVTFSVDVKINLCPVPSSQVRLPQFCVIERFCVEGSNKCSDHGALW